VKYKENWSETKERFDAWWKRSSLGRPMLKLVARREQPLEDLEPETPFDVPVDMHLGVVEKIKRLKNVIRSHAYMAESFPALDLNIGPGSLAVYLGSEPIFTCDTVWYKEVVRDWREFGALKYDPENYWWKRHLEHIRQAKSLSHDEFLVNIPDIVENVDILSALRGPQNLCYDLIDEPDLIKDYVRQVDQLYFKYYNSLYDIVKLADGSSSYTAYSVWGTGKTAKVQCDFSALMSPSQFREYVQPSLRSQCRLLDHSIYHLDGPDAIKHVDALMEIEELDALQWTAGAGRPDGGCEMWYPIYDKVKAAGKSLWISIYDGNLQKMTDSADKLVKRYGSEGLYLIFPVMLERDAQDILDKANQEWK